MWAEAFTEEVLDFHVLRIKYFIFYHFYLSSCGVEIRF